MDIGFVGAGRMGFTMGKHLVDYIRDTGNTEIVVKGYYNRTPDYAREAAAFTDTDYYENLEALVNDCDTIFITVSDGAICEQVQKLDKANTSAKELVLIHTSGALSSDIFSGMSSPVYGYSIHPIYAVSSRTASYVNFRDAFVTIEGHERYIKSLCSLFENMGHKVKAIAAEGKIKYHAAAVCGSNLVIGLFHMAVRQLVECGFTEAEANEALMPLFMNNANALQDRGCENALTGPVSRNDAGTVREHLEVLQGDVREIYRLLSGELVGIADRTADGSYDELRKILFGGKDE